MIVKILIGIYFALNCTMLIAIINEGEVIPKTMTWQGRCINYLFVLTFGVASFLCLLFAFLSKPYWIRLKWYKRQKKIRKAILKERDRNNPKDSIVSVF